MYLTHFLLLFLVCFVKSFYFVWCEVVSSCQECLGEGPAVAVPARWAVGIAKVAVRISVGWRVVGNANVISSSKYRPIRWATVYGICSSWTIFPCLRQFNRCPSWFVHQWKQKCFGVVLPPTAGIYQREIKDGTKCNLRRFFLILTLEIKAPDQRQTWKQIPHLKRMWVWYVLFIWLCSCRTSTNILKPKK